jgi:hypothetical protein
MLPYFLRLLTASDMIGKALRIGQGVSERPLCSDLPTLLACNCYLGLIDGCGQWKKAMTLRLESNTLKIKASEVA